MDEVIYKLCRIATDFSILKILKSVYKNLKVFAIIGKVDGYQGESVMECQREENLLECTCSATKCKNRGMCCECVKHHREAGQIPGCFFPKSAEMKHDRSIEYFIEVFSKF